MINWQIYPPEEASSGQELWFDISIVRAHIERTTSRYPLVEASSGQEWWLEISTVRANIGQINWQIYLPSRGI